MGGEPRRESFDIFCNKDSKNDFLSGHLLISTSVSINYASGVRQTLPYVLISKEKKNFTFLFYAYMNRAYSKNNKIKGKLLPEMLVSCHSNL